MVLDFLTTLPRAWLSNGHRGGTAARRSSNAAREGKVKFFHPGLAERFSQELCSFVPAAHGKGRFTGRRSLPDVKREGKQSLLLFEAARQVQRRD